MLVFFFRRPLSLPPPSLIKGHSVKGEPRDAKGRWRANATPKRMPLRGFDGPRGHSHWRSDIPQVAELLAGRTLEFRGGFPCFSPFVPRIGGLKARVRIAYTGDRNRDFVLGDQELARKLRWLNRRGKPDAARVARYRKANALTWHHHERGCDTLELVPTVLHDAARHCGGFSLCA